MSDNEYIMTGVRAVFKSAFDVDPDLVSIETSTSDIPSWDSVGHLSLASNLEQVFDVSLDVDDLMEMESVRDIVRILTAKLSAKSAQ